MTEHADPCRLLHVFSTFRVGGPQVRFSQIANALGEKYHHTIVAMDDAYAAEELLEPHVPFTRLSLEEMVQKRSGRTLNDLRIDHRLQLYRGILGQQKPHKLITYNWGSIEWALANMVPVCAHLHIEDGFGPEEATRTLRRRNWTRRFALSNHTDIVVPSHTLEHIAKKTWRLPADDVHLIPNGIDCSRFDHGPDPDLLARLALPKDVPIVGTIAALRKEKNLPRLIDAIAHVHRRTPCHLVIIGDGPERQALEDYARASSAAEHITFASHVTPPEKIMGALDLFAISSDTEQMPYSVLEAMACGLPVVGTNVGDVKAMVAPENHPLITPPDREPFQRALQACVEDATQRHDLGAANAAHVRSLYSLSDMIARYDAMFAA